MNLKLLGALLLVDLPVFYLLLKFLFKDWEDLEDAIAYWITPSIISAFRGEYWEDQWASMKIAVFFLLCSSIVGAEYYWITTSHPAFVARYFS